MRKVELMAYAVRQPLMARLDALHVTHSFLVSGVIMFVLVFGLSAASYYGIEKPARDWSRRLMGRRPLAIASEPSAP
jgi:peptidoglycan/LPS O-acetylase OafA/YrhL